ncbi:putative ABC transport system permease protein [Monaibacterium marinum]|uniref:Putative ABC transport system permease protein n=1 Tax=Pontivivens marinum TaxID=1690039 RepID=A0A2C9CPN3_9RHOB|nr:FtsX-like permease family protein [Monaibacterium marinum]SOH92319.1 putative ABC transport system permease protein [Monaibacterium marinum]
MSVAWRIARRELRGGLRGFYIFLTCLALGVAAIAAVGSVRSGIEAGLTQEGAALLGGDAQAEFTYRFASDEERAWLDQIALDVSETVDFRSMAVVGDERGLTQVRGVDDLYPLYGSVILEPAMYIAEALEMRDLPGAVMQPVLAARLDITVGDTFQLGEQEFELRALLQREPDSAGAGFGLGPRTIVTMQGLEASGLITPGTLFETEYRLRLAQGTDLNALETAAEDRFADSGLRWRDSRNGAPGVARFVERLGAFLVLVGLSGLAVGGLGVSAAVRSYLDRKIDTIATLKTLGAEGRVIFAIYFIQVGILSVIGVTLGLILGALVPLALGPVIEAQLPVPAVFTVYPGPLIEAALYGLLTAAIFVIWPLARAQDIRAAGLFRDVAGAGVTLPRVPYMIVIAVLALGLVGLATWFSGVWKLSLGAAGGILAALAILAVMAWLVRIGARSLARARIMRGRPELRLALGAVGGPGGETSSVILSLGLGLTVLAAVGQIEANTRNAISQDLPEIAPAYFFLDIQNAQLPEFLATAQAEEGVTRIDTAPMLRGILTQINGQTASEVAGPHWVLRGDRGVTYAGAQPEDAQIVEGTWWPDDYAGPPLISFAAEEGAELGLSIGDKLTINVLGRDIEGEIANFRAIEFGNLGINFVIMMNEGALAGAPHTHIATLYADEAAEGPLLRLLSRAFPNITAIGVRDAISRVSEALGGLAAATSYGAAATLVTGFVVLIGAAAAGTRRRVFEAAVLKTVGATRARILLSFALRSAILGIAAGCVAIAGGALAGWAVMTFVMEAEFAFQGASALMIVIGGALASLLAGLAFAWAPLAARPARVLRSRD